MKSAIRETGIRFVKHTVFSLAGTGTNTLVMWLCSHCIFTSATGQRLISPFIAFEVANMVNFIVSSKMVFNDRDVEPGIRSVLKRFAIYNMSYSATFLLNLGLLQVFVRVTNWDVVICNLISLAIAGILNFIMNTKVTFKNRTSE